MSSQCRELRRQLQDVTARDRGNGLRKRLEEALRAEHFMGQELCAALGEELREVRRQWPSCERLRQLQVRVFYVLSRR